MPFSLIVPIPPQVSYEISTGILEWFSKDSTITTELVVVGSVATGGEGERVFGVATTQESLEKIQDTITILPALSITGISGSLIIEPGLCGVPATDYLVETNFNVDPHAAISALNLLNLRYGFAVETSLLLEQAGPGRDHDAPACP